MSIIYMLNDTNSEYKLKNIQMCYCEQILKKILAFLKINFIFGLFQRNQNSHKKSPNFTNLKKM